MASGRRLPKGNEPSLATKFGSAGMAACIADVATFPLDTAKVRLQIQGETGSKSAPGRQIGLARTAVKSSLKYKGIGGTLLTISKEEGARALYNGLCPGLQRQLCFASIRIGLYDSVKQFYMDVFDANGTTPASNVGLRILAGITTGGVAISCAQPTDVVKVRMQAASRGTAAVRYNGTIHAYKTIATQEGVRGLWKGLFPNITRNAIVNAAELVSYDLIKEAIVKHNLLSDSMPCHFISAFCAGFCATCIGSPVDVVKTRFMNSPEGVYSGALQCAKVMFKTNGITSFYKGFVPSFMRLGSWNVVMFVCYEQIKRRVTGYLNRDTTTKTANRTTLTPARAQHL